MGELREARIIQQRLVRILDQHPEVVVAPPGNEFTGQRFYLGGVEILGVEEGCEEHELALCLLEYPGDGVMYLLACLQTMVFRVGLRAGFVRLAHDFNYSPESRLIQAVRPQEGGGHAGQRCAPRTVVD